MKKNGFIFILLAAVAMMLTACGGGGGGGDGVGGEKSTSYTVSTSAGVGGSISPTTARVNEGETAAFTVAASNGYDIDSVTGCGGTLIGNLYTTAPVTSDCTVSVNFVSTAGTPPTPPTVSISDASITEGNVGTTSLVFTVTLSALAGEDVHVDYRTDDATAKSPEDYQSTSGTLVIPSGNLSATIVVPVVGDTLTEDSETFSVTLSSPSGASLADAVATGEIIDDDSAGSLPVISLGGRHFVSEGDSGTNQLKYFISLWPAATSDVSVEFNTREGSASNGTDFVPKSGTITIPAGSRSASIEVDTLGDTVIEGDEFVVLELSNPVGARLDSSRAVGVIADDDTAESLPHVGVSPGPKFLGESGNVGVKTINFGIGKDINSEVTVSYSTVDGTASAGSDYVAASGTLTIPVGVPSATIPVEILDDNVIEGDESFELVLSNPQGAVMKESESKGVGIIVDDDSRLAPPVFVVSDASVIEGDGESRYLKFTVKSTVGGNGSVGRLYTDATVDYATANDTARSGVDYASATGTLTIPAGSNPMAEIVVDILGDRDTEGDEKLVLTLSNPSANIAIGRAQATGIIIDDEGVSARGLNDTGITTCSDARANDLICPVAGFPGQDAEFGRDFFKRDEGDGHAGYSFVKLDGNGAPLPDQSVNYASMPWDCVRDKVTGLVWEVKTKDGGLRDNGWTYSWYNSTGVNDGGSPGTPNGGKCFDTVNCDTEKYVAQINSVGLCGWHDWRMPALEELLNLWTDRSSLDFQFARLSSSFKGRYFPNVNLFGDYWTSSSAAKRASDAWRFDFRYGRAFDVPKVANYAVRLVRDDN